MRIIATSDWHFEYRESFCKRTVDSILDRTQEGDVFIFGGDLSKNYIGFMRGLEEIARIPSTKLFYLGNHDLFTIKNSKLGEHYDELSDRLAQFDIHLLDKEPKIVDRVGFAGHCGFFDGTLWREDTPHTDPTETYDHVITRVNHGFNDLFDSSYSLQIYFEHCLNRIKGHVATLEASDDVDKIAVGVHYVPSFKFLEYHVGENLTPEQLRFNDTAFFMGSHKLGSCYIGDKIKLGFTGHTHRNDSHDVEETHVIGDPRFRVQRVFNVSSTKEVPYHVFVF